MRNPNSGRRCSSAASALLHRGQSCLPYTTTVIAVGPRPTGCPAPPLPAATSASRGHRVREAQNRERLHGRDRHRLLTGDRNAQAERAQAFDHPAADAQRPFQGLGVADRGHDVRGEEATLADDDRAADLAEPGGGDHPGVVDGDRLGAGRPQLIDDARQVDVLDDRRRLAGHREGAVAQGDGDAGTAERHQPGRDPQGGQLVPQGLVCALALGGRRLEPGEAPAELGHLALEVLTRLPLLPQHRRERVHVARGDALLGREDAAGAELDDEQEAQRHQQHGEERLPPGGAARHSSHTLPSPKRRSRSCGRLPLSRRAPGSANTYSVPSAVTTWARTGRSPGCSRTYRSSWSSSSTELTRTRSAGRAGGPLPRAPLPPLARAAVPLRAAAGPGRAGIPLARAGAGAAAAASSGVGGSDRISSQRSLTDCSSISTLPRRRTTASRLRAKPCCSYARGNTRTSTLPVRSSRVRNAIVDPDRVTLRLTPATSPPTTTSWRSGRSASCATVEVTRRLNTGSHRRSG